MSAEDAPTNRFSRRVDDYVKYRPSYPPAVLHTLTTEFGLHTTAVIADIGCGTGLLAQLFLDNGHTVYGVEPNEAMRQGGIAYLENYVNFHSIAASAEATTLPPASVDFVVAGQAAHWFDGSAAAAEFQRILRPGGRIMLVWNTRDVQANPFMQANEATMQQYEINNTPWPFCAGGHPRGPAAILGETAVTHTFTNQQQLDEAGFIGRTLSTSTIPLPDHPHHAPLLAELRRLFAHYQVNGRVILHYRTEMYTAVPHQP